MSTGARCCHQRGLKLTYKKDNIDGKNPEREEKEDRLDIPEHLNSEEQTCVLKGGFEEEPSSSEERQDGGLEARGGVYA